MMLIFMTQFKIDTATKDKTDLENICHRLRKIMPDDAAKKSKVQKFIDEAKAAYESVKKFADDQLDEAREKGKLKWYCMYSIDRNYCLATNASHTDFIPVIGTIILIVDRVKQQGILKSLADLNNQYELTKKQSDNQIEQVTATSRKFGKVAFAVQCRKLT
jgi:hypothetical protein